MSHKRVVEIIIVLSLILFLAALGFLGFVWFKKGNLAKKSHSATKMPLIGKDYPQKNSLPPANLQKLRQNYQQEIALLRQQFAAEEKKPNPQWGAFAQKATQSLLKEIVPPSKKNFHLQLVLTLNNLAQAAQENKAEAVKKDVSRLQKLLAQK